MKLLKLWLPVAVWAALIFCLSSIPRLESPFEYDFVLRKLAHITEYFILTLLLYRAFKGSFALSAFYLFILPVGVSLLYAASDEFHQLFVAGRHGSTQDVLIDAVGIIGFYVLGKASKRLN